MPIGGRGRNLVTTLQVAGQAAYNASMGAAAASTSSVGTAANDASVDMLAMGKAEQAAAVAGHEYAASQGTAAISTEALAAAASQAQMAVMAYLAVLAAYAAAVGATAAASWKATQRANEFETALTNIDTQAGYTEDQMRALADRILSANSALTPEEWAGAMAPFAYAGYQAEQAWQAAEAAARASEAYMTDTKETAGALLKTMEAYNIEAQYAAYTMDVLAQAAASGTMEMTDLARYIPRVASAGAEAGASLEEMAATLSAISFYAGSAEEATGGLRTLYRALANAGYDAQITQEGLVSVLRDVMKQTGGNRQALQEMLGSAEAVDAFLKLATGDFQKLEDAMDGMESAAGTVNDALAGRQDSLQHALDVVAQNIDQVIIKIGEIIKLQEGGWVEAIKVVSRAMSDYFSMVLDGLEKEREQTRDTREEQVQMAMEVVDVLHTLGKMLIATGRVVAMLTVQFGLNAQQVLYLALAYHEARLGWLKLKQAMGRPVEFGAIGAAKGSVDEIKTTIDSMWDAIQETGPFAPIWDELQTGLDEMKDYAEENIPDIFSAMDEDAPGVQKPPETKVDAESDAADNAERLADAIDLQREYQKDLAAQADLMASQTDNEIRKAQIRATEARYMLTSEEALLDVMQQSAAEYEKIADQRRAVTKAQSQQNDAEQKLNDIIADRRAQLSEQASEQQIAMYNIQIAQAQIEGNLQKEIDAHQKLLAYLKDRAALIKQTANDPRRYEDALRAVLQEQEKLNRLQDQGQKDMLEGAEKLKNEVNQIYNAYQRVIGGELGGQVAEEIKRLTAQTREFRRSRRDRQDPFVANASRRNIRTIRLRIEGGSEGQADDVGNMLMRSLEGSDSRGGGFPPK